MYAFKRWDRAVCVLVFLKLEEGSGTGGLEREPELWGNTHSHTYSYTHTHTQPGESETVQTHQSVLTDQSPGRHVRRGTQSKRRRENRREIDLTSLQGHVHVRSSQRDCSSRRAGVCASLRERQGEV